MKYFKQTRQFVDDVRALCNGVMTDEFYLSDRVHSLIIDIFNKYTNFDVRTLSEEFSNDIEQQSLEGIQDAFNIWKVSLNNIVIPDHDNVTFPFAGYGERTIEGKEILSWIKDICWELRESVAEIMEHYGMSNNNPVENFLSAPYYKAGDVGQRKPVGTNMFGIEYEGNLKHFHGDWPKGVDTARLLKRLVKEGLAHNITHNTFVDLYQQADFRNVATSKVTAKRLIRFFYGFVIEEEKEEYLKAGAMLIDCKVNDLTKGNGAKIEGVLNEFK